MRKLRLSYLLKEWNVSFNLRFLENKEVHLLRLSKFHRISSPCLGWRSRKCAMICSLVYLTTISNTNLQYRNSRQGWRDIDVDKSLSKDTLMRQIWWTLLVSSLTQLPWTVGSFIWFKGYIEIKEMGKLKNMQN